MATFYSIHAYDQNTCDGDDLLNTKVLYSTFEKACDAIEKEIQLRTEKFEPPNFMDLMRQINMGRYVHYYETEDGTLFVINKWNVAD